MKISPYQKVKDKGMRYLMNKKEEQKALIIRSCVEGEMSVKSAAMRLKLSERQVKNLKMKYRKEGYSSILHGNCGRQPKHTISAEVRQNILEIRALPEFSTVNTLHFKEILEEKYSVKVSYSFLHSLFKKHGVKSSKQHRKPKKHNRRKRKEYFGEMLQADATSHQFFENDDKYYALHGFIDDATNMLTGLYMCENECMEGYFEVTRQTLKNYGIPLSIYADGGSIFFSTKKEKLSIEEQLLGVLERQTQYGHIMNELGVTLIHARSSQAKGRVERLWETLQNRLITEFKMHNISTIEAANKFLKTYINRFNKKFSLPPLSVRSDFVPIQSNLNLNRLLSVKYTRTLDNGGCFSLNNIIFKLNNCSLTPKTKITVLISKRIGVVALHDEKIYSVTPILDKDKKQVNSTESVQMIIAQFVFANCLKNERAA